MATMNIYGSKMVYTSKNSPSSTFTPGSIVTIDDGYGQSGYNADKLDAFMSFDIPATLKKKRILDGTFYAYTKSDDGDGTIYHPIYDGYRDNFTYNNKPTHYYNYKRLKDSKSFAWSQNYYSEFWGDVGYQTGTLEELIKNGVWFSQDARGSSQVHTPYSGNRPYIMVNYEGIQLSVRASPASGFIDKHKPIQFTVTGTPGNQEYLEQPLLKSAVIQWRNGNTGNWNNVTIKAGSNGDAVHILPANSITADFLQWRVVSALSDDDVSNTFSDIYILSTVDSISTAVPLSPLDMMINVEIETEFSWKHIITTGSDPTGYELQYSTDVTNTARPTVYWQSVTQIAYELIIRKGVIECIHTQETASTDKTFTTKDYLQDGNYTVSARIKNSGFYWSAWASLDFTIRTIKPEVPIISGEQVRNGVKIKTNSTEDTMYLLRDGIPIAKISDESYDYSTVGVHSYVIRRVNAADTFADSIPLPLETKIQQAVIAAADYPENMIGSLLQTAENQYPSVSNIGAELLHYAGRKYPVAVTNSTIEEEFSPIFASLVITQWLALQSLMIDTTTILYRNCVGECAYCIITEMSPTKLWNGFTTWEMTMQRVDYIERIDYDEVVG